MVSLLKSLKMTLIMLLDADTLLVVSPEGLANVLCEEQNAEVDIRAFRWMEYIDPDTEGEIYSAEKKSCYMVEYLTKISHRLQSLQEDVGGIKETWTKETRMSKSSIHSKRDVADFARCSDLADRRTH